MNPNYAKIRTSTGAEKTVSLRDLAPPLPSETDVPELNYESPCHEEIPCNNESTHIPDIELRNKEIDTSQFTRKVFSNPSIPEAKSCEGVKSEGVRRSSRNTVQIDRLSYDKLGGED